MKSIIALSFLLLALQANSIADAATTACEPFYPSPANSAYNYVQCYMGCELVQPREVECTFGMQNSPMTKSKTRAMISLEVPIKASPPIENYMCISPFFPISLNELPYQTRGKCVKCETVENGSNTIIKCNNLSEMQYTMGSGFALESYLQGKPATGENFHKGRTWRVFSLNSAGARVEQVEIDVADGVNYRIHTHFTS